jgi:hypothetical protein
MSRKRKYYYSLAVPATLPVTWQPELGRSTHGPSKWHPTETTGPFAVLSRGAFPSKWEAEAWAQEELQGAPASMRRYRRYTKKAPKFVRGRISRHARTR